jgi:hypothetical protein
MLEPFDDLKLILGLDGQNLDIGITLLEIASDPDQRA